MLKWIQIIRIASSTLINSQSDHGIVSVGVTSNIEISSNLSNSWAIATKIEPDDPVSYFLSLVYLCIKVM